MSTLPTVRLYLIVAREAPRILIIRRGPTRVYHLALWHTDTDVVEHGSWFRGQLYVHRCDLSWDGQRLVYFAMGPTRQHYSWTAVSRPPWVKEAEGRFGHPIHSQADLQAIGPILREDRTWSFEKPQTYVVGEEGVFVLGGQINEHVDAAGGQPVLAAGEAVLEEQHDGTWVITALNNRSYGYMPGPESWPAVERALHATGIRYPNGFAEVHPLEGTWAEILAVLRS